MTTKLPRPGSLWREPLVQFVAIGALVFVLSMVFGGDNRRTRESRQVTVTLGQVERMAASWTTTWGRRPSEAELQGLVRDYIREEIYYREGLKLGLDIGDPVIRSRVRQKMELFTVEGSGSPQPSEADIADYYASHPGLYRRAATHSFRQIYTADADSARIASTLDLLRSNSTDGRTIGETISLPASMDKATVRDIKGFFGDTFFEELGQVEAERWAGPVASGFGQHLVLVTERVPGERRDLTEVRSLVIEDWKTATERRARDEAYNKLRTEYDVRIETP